ncbi:disease resistance protein RPS2 [Vigna unguiculata]|uniref:Disease resistance protein RPS2 n=1 Tax=Vigna unguiculata TaxID=3917 RepID=A0A4D6LL62_VIGUN|nr:disease resistance protein RPS2 [Vigna unguiculata]
MILDDVWEKLDFARIGIPSSEHHKGCKILITARSVEVCISMDCQRKIYLPILTDEEAWTLFQNKALISKDTPDTLKRMARLISDECKQLPVLIVAVASSLKGKAETIWSVALNKLKHSKPINIEKGLTDPYKCLQLSYDNLDDKEAKSLFLLCSVFPEDFEIQVEVLTRCAIGLGVVGEAQSYEEARSEVIAAKIKLVSCCLLLDADDECVKMHDIVRDVAHIIAKDENNMIKCEEEKDVTVEHNSVRYLWCVKFPNDLDCSNLEFLFLRTKKEFDEIFKTMGMLKVLILVNDEDENTPLPKISFQTLTNLRYLHIYGYELSDFSFIRDMKKLQSLSLHGCSLPSFPELQSDVAITQLTTLKLLELHICDIKLKNFEVIKRIPLLEELYIIDIAGEWYANSEDNIEFFKTFSVPETLQRYGIVLRSREFGHYNHEDVYLHGRTLLLNHFDISNEVIKGLAKKAKDLFVGNIDGGAKNMIPDIFEIEGGGLNELNKLEILGSEELECLIDTTNNSSEVMNVFSQLHTLKMDDMENLKVIWHCVVPANGPFEKLEKLYLSDCPQLTSLFTYVVAQRLVQLKILKIKRCNELKHILTDGEKMEKSQDEFSTWHPVRIFPNLEEVKIKSCKELKYIFSGNIVGGLGQLKVLEIEECDMLDQIIGDIVPLAEQDRKEEVDEIIEEGKHPHSHSTSIPTTTVLKHNPASTTKSLTSLEELFIEDCDGLVNIVDSGEEYDTEILKAIFPNLRKLSVRFCGQLKYMFGQYPLENQDYKEIHIQFSALEILSLDYLPNFVSICATNTLTVTCPSLKDFYCHKCSFPFYNGVGYLTLPTDSREPISINRKEIGDVGNESIKSSSTGVATDIESGGEDILALDSEVVEQDDKMNEDKAGIQVEEGLNLLHKQEEIDVVPNNNIHISSDIHARLGAYKHFVDLDNAQIALLLEAITTYPHLWNASKKFSERFQAWRLKILADMLLFLQKESVDSVIPQREKEFHKLCEEAIEVGFESSWVEEMRQRVVARDPKLGEDIAKTQIDENSKRCSCGDTVPDSQGDGPNITFEEGSNSVDKGGEIVVSNDHIVAQSNEEPEQEFVAEVSTSEIPIIATSLTNSQPVERPTPSYFYIPLRETPSNALVDTQRNSEPFLMNQKKSVGEIPQVNDKQKYHKLF